MSYPLIGLLPRRPSTAQVTAVGCIYLHDISLSGIGQGVRMRGMARQIALLRGINGGGNKKVEMARLRALMEELGYRDVKTHLNSGNVVFTGPRRSERHLEAAIAKTFGLRVPVLPPSRDEIADVVRANPLREVASDPSKHLVVFCGAEAATDLDP